ncbi:hypothetical protein LLEC1_07882 [Akanthomyces lecanii]|uniref:Aminoglycoside phosphotransferase domain-containing protein n=1 Tax=Cordyceps confragosa TaxID=2714763 RepID=A0A179IRX7_CORDF|nr:hypothetical protein LLEC1_07882 [Akanthomyces lecanii]
MAMKADDVAWEESDRIERVWRHSLFEESTLRAVGRFISKHRRGVPTELCEPKAGGFNALFRMKFIDGGSAVIRFTKPGLTMFPEEKVKHEVATMRFIQNNTAIPVPFVHHWGTREESPLNIGPFIIMEYMNHEMDMTDALNTLSRVRSDRPILNPDVDEVLLKSLYGQVAKILLQLSKLEFPLIGALEETDEWSWEVTRRPLSITMNELVRVGTLPQHKLPTTTFGSSSEYFQSLATLHVDHLAAQRNDAVDSKADCERKYVARQLFQKLSREKRLLSPEHDKGPFKLWCYDLRPSNILLDANHQIVAVIDWEFSYAAPREFTFAPPWWLLLEQPEYWTAGLDDWVEVYEKRLPVFFEAMTEAEDDLIASGRLQEEERLSGKMRDSWASGDFWTVYAARKNFAFDGVYWKKLDSRFFGPVEGSCEPEDVWKQRLGLLDPQTRSAMESFVERKMLETETRALAWDPDEYSLEYQVALADGK